LPIAGSLNFHKLGLIIAGGCSVVAIVISFYSIFMHASHYTKPREQRQYVTTFPARTEDVKLGHG
jgi:hypothetical protein